MRLMTFLTRRQAWLLSKDIAREFRPAGKTITGRTVERWFAFLREHGGFTYYPYPKASALGLQDILVQVRGLKDPKILGILPFAASFNVEVGLADGAPFVTQAYWVPGDALRPFEEFWETARDLGLLEEARILRSRNTHTIFSPFHEAVTADGHAEIPRELDNTYFASLLKRNLAERFEVRLAERVAASPLVIPIVIEHLWQHHSSKGVWESIQAMGTEHLRRYGGNVLRKVGSPGAAVKLLQRQWRGLVEHYDEVFLQPRVFFDWPSLKDSVFLSCTIGTDSDKMLDTALRISRWSIVTAFKPGLGPEGWCHLACFLPSSRVLNVLRIVHEAHRRREPPVVAMQDQEATFGLFQPAYCKVDWRLFDPVALSWRFDGEAYMERLKGLRP